MSLADELSILIEQISVLDHGHGIAFCAMRDGEVLVSAVAGAAGNGSALAVDTLLPVFSGTKGVVAAVVATLVDRRLLSYDDLLSRYWAPATRWPQLTVAHAMSHRAGLPHLDPPTSMDDLWDTDLMLERLGATTPLFPPGSRVSYHWLNYGWFAEALVRAVDGRTIGRFIAEEIAGPWGLEVMLGVPIEVQAARCGRIERADDYRTNVFVSPGNPYIARVYDNPRTLDAERNPFNDPGNVARELPGGGAWATATAMCGFYDALLHGKDGRRLLSVSTLDAAWQTVFDDTDPVTERPISMSMGWERDDSLGTFGRISPAFGHSGAGGSVHGCWPELGVSFSFLPQLMRTDQADGRSRRVLMALADRVSRRSCRRPVGRR